MDLKKPEESKEETLLDSSNAPDTKKNGDKPKREVVLPDALQKQLKEAAKPEDKAQILLGHVEESLGHTPPKFKDFWDGRSTLLNLLKEITTPPSRNAVWEKLSFLTQEARRIKEDLIKESAFAEEQIERAISSLEKEIEASSADSNEIENLFSKELALFKENQPFYFDTQATLNQLNAFASQINALRKELIKTSLRIRTKNQFFDRLSKAGNQVFPKRKELIQKISTQFTEDVLGFCKETKAQLTKSPHLMTMRQQIQELQKLAKALTLNTYSFNETRKELSGLWDKMKVQEKEKKKEHSQFKEESKEIMEPILEEVNQIDEDYQKGEITVRQAEEVLSSHLSKMRRIRLDWHHAKQLKARILEIKKPIDDKIDEDAKAFEEREKAKEVERKRIVQEYKDQVNALISQVKELDYSAIEEKSKELKEKRSEIHLLNQEKKEIDKLFKGISVLVSEKKEEALLNLPEEDRQYLENLKQVLKQRIERRNEIRENLERLKSQKAQTGLDFAQAFTIDDQVREEKLMLDKINEGVVEIEAKIANIS